MKVIYLKEEKEEGGISDRKIRTTTTAAVETNNRRRRKFPVDLKPIIFENSSPVEIEPSRLWRVAHEELVLGT